jgi:threonine dehydratase
MNPVCTKKRRKQGLVKNSSTDMFGRIEVARERLRGWAAVTPVHTSRTLNRMVGADVFLKCENFQRVGAFKFRGAYNAVSRLSDEEKARGVITFSSGNHAQAMALVGHLLGVATTVVMPIDAPAIKRAATEAYGATVIDYDPQTGSREEIARRLEVEHGFTMIPPYDHEDVIAVKGANPTCRVIGVEPELADDATKSFKTGTLHTVHNPPTIADGTRTPCLGKLTFPLVRKYVDDMQTVSEAAIMEAVRFLFYRMKLVVEPSGALGVAALINGRLTFRGKIGVIVSGGNIDGPTMTRILNAVF